MAAYIIDTDRPTTGPWRETSFGHRYASATLADGRRVHISVERVKRVRIAFKPRGPGAYGWRYEGTVRDSVTMKILACDRVPGSIGVRGMLILAGLVVPAPAVAP